MISYIGNPLWLALPLAPLLLLFFTPRNSVLPGSWAQQVNPGLSAFIKMHIAEQKSRYRFWLYLGLWMALATSLAAISLGYTDSPGTRNPHARVVVIDLGTAAGSSNVANARRFIASTTNTPTGIVAVTSQAFDVVPITTDHSHIERYLQVLSARLMPVSGRQFQPGIESARSMLERSNILAPQIVLFTSGPVPVVGLSSITKNTGNIWFSVDVNSSVVDAGRSSAVTADKTTSSQQQLANQTLSKTPSQTAFHTSGQLLQQWRSLARQGGIKLTTPGRSHELIRELESSRQQAVENSMSIRERRELTPWFTGLSLMLWIVLFFRKPAS